MQLTMILHEVLRLYPPAIAISRKTYKEMEIGGVRYPAGVVIDLPVLLIHHDPDLWGSDVHEFRPDRFAEGGLQGARRVLPIRLEATHLHRPELRAARGQDGSEHDPSAVGVRARAILHSCATHRDHTAPDAWGTD